MPAGYRYLRNSLGLPAWMAQRVRNAIKDCMEQSDQLGLETIHLSDTGPTVFFTIKTSDGEMLDMACAY